MPNLKFRLSFATLIPDFIYQFLSSKFIDQKIFTCFELEDVRNSILNLNNNKLKKIKKCLMINNKNNFFYYKNNLDFLDDELHEIDGEYYHRYTAMELKYIFEQIIFNIEIIYDAFKKETNSNLILTIDFNFKCGLESNIVIEFFDFNETPSPLPLENIFFLPMDNYFVADNIIARLYFNFIQENKDKYEFFFNKISDIFNLKILNSNNLN